MVPESLIAKAIGAISGAVLALIFLPPKTFNGFLRRTSFSLGAGLIFSTAAMEKLNWEYTFDHMVAAATICAFISWWVTGAIITASRKWFGDKSAD